MPLYEYECQVCGVRFERQQLITDDALKTCPECGGEVRRVTHPTGIIFKGKGFYATDNRKAGSSTGAEAGEESEGVERRISSERREELERQIAELKRRWPAHSVPPTMLQQLDELEEESEREVNKAAEKK